VRRGQVKLTLGSVERLPPFAVTFDKILAVNAMQFWSEPIKLLAELRGLLTSGGRIAIAFQPRGPRATDEVAMRKGREIAAALRDAGFSHVRTETLKLEPAVSACSASTRRAAIRRRTRQTGNDSRPWPSGRCQPLTTEATHFIPIFYPSVLT
jgi:SAM-dependent methyltransferase